MMVLRELTSEVSAGVGSMCIRGVPEFGQLTRMLVSFDSTSPMGIISRSIKLGSNSRVVTHGVGWEFSGGVRVEGSVVWLRT